MLVIDIPFYGLRFIWNHWIQILYLSSAFQNNMSGAFPRGRILSSLELNDTSSTSFTNFASSFLKNCIPEKFLSPGSLQQVFDYLVDDVDEFAMLSEGPGFCKRKNRRYNGVFSSKIRKQLGRRSFRPSDSIPVVPIVKQDDIVRDSGEGGAVRELCLEEAVASPQLIVIPKQPQDRIVCVDDTDSITDYLRKVSYPEPTNVYWLNSDYLIYECFTRRLNEILDSATVLVTPHPCRRSFPPEIFLQPSAQDFAGKKRVKRQSQFFNPDVNFNATTDTSETKFNSTASVERRATLGQKIMRIIDSSAISIDSMGVQTQNFSNYKKLATCLRQNNMSIVDYDPLKNSKEQNDSIINYNNNIFIAYYRKPQKNLAQCISSESIITLYSVRTVDFEKVKAIANTLQSPELILLEMNIDYTGKLDLLAQCVGSLQEVSMTNRGLYALEPAAIQAILACYTSGVYMTVTFGCHEMDPVFLKSVLKVKQMEWELGYLRTQSDFSPDYRKSLLDYRLYLEQLKAKYYGNNKTLSEGDLASIRQGINEGVDKTNRERLAKRLAGQEPEKDITIQVRRSRPLEVTHRNFSDFFQERRENRTADIIVSVMNTREEILEKQVFYPVLATIIAQIIMVYVGSIFKGFISRGINKLLPCCRGICRKCEGDESSSSIFGMTFSKEESDLIKQAINEWVKAKSSEQLDQHLARQELEDENPSAETGPSIVLKVLSSGQEAQNNLSEGEHSDAHGNNIEEATSTGASNVEEAASTIRHRSINLSTHL